MFLLEQRNLKLLLAALFVVTSGVLFWVGRGYRNQNIPLWRVKLHGPGAGQGIRKIVWGPNRTIIWVQTASGKPFLLDAEGQTQSNLSITSSGGAGPEGEFLTEQTQTVDEWKNGRYTVRTDLQLPTSDFEDHNYDEHSAHNDWASLSVLGADARGPVHIWPMQRNAKPITLSAPEPDGNLRHIPYDFAVSPDRSRAVIVYDLGRISNGWKGNWTLKPPSFSSEGGRIALFDLKSQNSEEVGTTNTSSFSPPRLAFGRAAVKFSPSGKLFTVLQSYYPEGNGLQIYDSTSGQKRARALIDAKMQSVYGGTESVAFSPDETMLAACSWKGWVQVWSVTTGKSLQLFYGRSQCFAISWSPDSRKLAVGNELGEVSLWNVAPFAPPKSH